MRHGAFEKNHQVAGVRADIEQAYAQFALVGRKRSLGGGDRLQHRFGYFKPGAVSACNGALKSAPRTCSDVQVHFKPRADHAHRIEDTRLVIDDELARQKV